MIAIIAKWEPQFGKTTESAINIESPIVIVRNYYRIIFNNIEYLKNTLNFYKRNYRGNKHNIKLSLIKNDSI